MNCLKFYRQVTLMMICFCQFLLRIIRCYFDFILLIPYTVKLVSNLQHQLVTIFLTAFNRQKTIIHFTYSLFSNKPPLQSNQKPTTNHPPSHLHSFENKGRHFRTDVFLQFYYNSRGVVAMHLSLLHWRAWTRFVVCSNRGRGSVC